MPKIQLSTSITTLPFLPNNVVVTDYNSFMIMIQIENAGFYQGCFWLRNSSFIGAIFSRESVVCNNRTDSATGFKFTCVEANNIIKATATYMSPVQEHDSSLHQVFCRLHDLSEVVIAQIDIKVSGTVYVLRTYAF